MVFRRKPVFRTCPVRTASTSGEVLYSVAFSG